MPKAIAIAFSDLHLSLTQPVCRADKDWLVVQAGYLKQVRDIAKELGGVPVLCAGDIFDRWNPPPELINFALEHLPTGMISVPGQHDLPNHRIEDMHRSGYGVLVKARKILDIAGSSLVSKDFGFTVYGAGWGQQLGKYGPQASCGQHIGLVHRYLWAYENKRYIGAPSTSHIQNQPDQFNAYDWVISGDNHTLFTATLKHCTVINPGGFIRRKSDERLHAPSVYILYDNDSSDRHKLDVSGDLFHEDIEDRSEVPVNMKAFIDGLEKLGEHGLDFRQAVEQHLKSDDVEEATKQIILDSLK